MSDKMRAEFEAWAINNDYGLHINQNGSYGDVYAEWAWQAWQASRAALVVKLSATVCRTHVFELPHTNEVGMEHGEYFEVDDIKKSLDVAGVKYNG